MILIKTLYNIYKDHPSLQAPNLANTSRKIIVLSSTSRTRSTKGTRSKTTLGEPLPDLASVNSSSKSLVSIKDGVTGGDECWTTWLSIYILVKALEGKGKEVDMGNLQSQSINDKLHSQEASISRHAINISRLALRIDAVLLNQVPQDFIEHSRPNCSCAVHTRTSS